MFELITVYCGNCVFLSMSSFNYVSSQIRCSEHISIAVLKLGTFGPYMSGWNYVSYHRCLDVYKLLH